MDKRYPHTVGAITTRGGMANARNFNTRIFNSQRCSVRVNESIEWHVYDGWVRD